VVLLRLFKKQLEWQRRSRKLRKPLVKLPVIGTEVLEIVELELETAIAIIKIRIRIRMRRLLFLSRLRLYAITARTIVLRKEYSDVIKEEKQGLRGYKTYGV
jgi:hypothetical protein